MNSAQKIELKSIRATRAIERIASTNETTPTMSTTTTETVTVAPPAEIVAAPPPTVVEFIPTVNPNHKLFTRGADHKYGDFRDDLIRDGFAVIKGAIPRERANGYADEMYKFLEDL
jgi:hypothetical protein